MTKLCYIALGLACIGAPISTYAAPPCAGLTGLSRTQCLKAEVARGARETEKINKKNSRLDKALKVACGADTAASAVSGAAGKVVAGTPGYVAAKGTYVGTRAAGNAMTGGKSSCTKKAE